MIQTELLPDGRTRTYSDEGMKIMQTDTGVIYDDAADQACVQHTYTETEIPIEEVEDETT